MKNSQYTIEGMTTCMYFRNRFLVDWQILAKTLIVCLIVFVPLCRSATCPSFLRIRSNTAA